MNAITKLFKASSSKWFESSAWSFTVSSCSAFNSAFVASISMLLFKSEPSMNPEISYIID